MVRKAKNSSYVVCSDNVDRDLRWVFFETCSFQKQVQEVFRIYVLSGCHFIRKITLMIFVALIRLNAWYAISTSVKICAKLHERFNCICSWWCPPQYPTTDYIRAKDFGSIQYWLHLTFGNFNRSIAVLKFLLAFPSLVFSFSQLLIALWTKTKINREHGICLTITSL